MLEKNKHSIGLWSLTCLGIGSMIGSGWLFSAYKTARLAGGGAVFVWLVAAAIIVLLALIIAEIGTLYPKRGLFGRVLAISHNKDMGYITAMANWFGTLVCVPMEAMATIQYLSKAKPDWNQYLFVNEDLTGYGLCIVTALILFYSVCNFWGARQLAKANNIITFFKILVPVITVAAIFYTAFHPVNFKIEGGTLFPHGVDGIATAILGGGVIYAFNGFQTIANFCSEAKNPGRNIPIALVLSILISLIVYVLLQIAFIGGIPPAMLSGGWSALSFQSPIVELSTLLGLHVMSLLLYVDAVVSPSGTGIVYAGATCRMLTGMSQEKQVPSFFDHLHPIFNFSRRSLCFNLMLSLLLLWFFKSWESLMIIASLFNVISYLASPVALMRLRITEPNKERPFKLSCANIICPVLFLLITILFCLAPEKDLMLVSSMLVVFYGMYIVVSNQGNVSGMLKAIRQSYPFLLYFVSLTGLGLLNNPHGGGLHIISDNVFYIGISVIGIVFYYWLVYGGLKDRATCTLIPLTESLSE